MKTTVTLDDGITEHVFILYGRYFFILDTPMMCVAWELRRKSEPKTLTFGGRPGFLGWSLPSFLSAHAFLSSFFLCRPRRNFLGISVGVYAL